MVKAKKAKKAKKASVKKSKSKSQRATGVVSSAPAPISALHQSGDSIFDACSRCGGCGTDPEIANCICDCCGGSGEEERFV